MQVNFYERTIELMKQNMEVERKEIAQGFKMEISELEEQKALAEERFKQLRQSVERLEGELKIKNEVMPWGPEQERRVQREQAELEQNYAREIANIVHRLTSEKDQLEAELKLKMDQEVLFVRWVCPGVLWSQNLQVNLSLRSSIKIICNNTAIIVDSNGQDEIKHLLTCFGENVVSHFLRPSLYKIKLGLAILIPSLILLSHPGYIYPHTVLLG